MKKVWIYLSVLIFGLLMLILEFALFRFDEIVGYLLTLTGVYMSLGGAIGACFSSKKARAFFFVLLETILG